MTASELVANADLALLANIDTHELVHAWWQFVAIFAGENLDVDDLAVFAVWHLEAGVANFACLLAKDGS